MTPPKLQQFLYLPPSTEIININGALNSSTNDKIREGRSQIKYREEPPWLKTLETLDQVTAEYCRRFFSDNLKNHGKSSCQFGLVEVLGTKGQCKMIWAIPFRGAVEPSDQEYGLRSRTEPEMRPGSITY